MADSRKDALESERIGRLGRAAPRDAVRIQTNNSGAPASRPESQSVRHPQRVTVKVSVVRHRTPESARDALRRHARYLGRPGAGLEQRDPQFFGREQEQVDPRTALHEWADDRNHFRVILSPENGHDLGDFREYVGAFVAQMERDLKTRLEWVSVVHHNTAHPHAHLIIRGRAEDDGELRIDRAYISHQMRARAEELATQRLGERTLNHARQSLLAEVQATRWTSLDRKLMAASRAQGDERFIDLRTLPSHPAMLLQPSLYRQRLQVLRELGLATPVEAQRRWSQPARWTFTPNLQAELRVLESHADIRRQIFEAAPAQVAASIAARVEPLPQQDRSQPPKIAAGVVLAKGPVNEIGEGRFVVVETSGGRFIHARVHRSSEYDNLRVGGLAAVGERDLFRAKMVTEILAVSTRCAETTYSPSGHREWLREHEPRLSPVQVEQRLQKFSAWLGHWSTHRKSGVERLDDPVFRFTESALREYAASRLRTADLRILSAHSLEEQIHARAYTWLDQTFNAMTREHRRVLTLPAVAEARWARAEVLLASGAARLIHNAKERTEIRFAPRAIESLLERERSEFAAARQKERGKAVRFLQSGQGVSGKYRGTAFLHQGAFALIESDRSILAAPIGRAPALERGEAVTLRWLAPNVAKLQRDSERSRRSPGMER